MLCKEITYTGYDNIQRTEKFYFNLTKSEILEMNLTTPGGMGAMLTTIAEKKDVPDMINNFKKIVLKSYGVKSPDGRRFMKGAEISKEFEETPAYDQLFMELATNADAANAFIQGVMPADMQEEIKKANAVQALPTV